MEKKGFFGSLFDLSFTEFVTTRIVAVLYVIGIIWAGIIGLAILIGGFKGGVGAGILGLIVAPVVFLICVLWTRVWLEVVIVFFRIAENTGRLVQQAEPAAAAEAPEEPEAE